MKLTLDSSVVMMLSPSPLAMPNTKVRPIIVVPNRPETPRHEPFQQIYGWQSIASPMNDDYGQECDYWHARRAFLSSYHFSERRGLKEKVKRSLKGLNEAAKGVVLEVRREISRRVGVRVYKLTMGWPALFTIRCFVPWPYKDNHRLCIDQ
ncbi:hypothetical protein Vadar_019419 [Vaccinium darrowii]|uniref:Uncharacterized protein n=1 Tax=Vaccinium darrowii TaxID=229202 RepID=A0ACB7X2F6_9ERIC|nr:hypothetical protein Vadar_019419 [Vaccinium darrowii]